MKRLLFFVALIALIFPAQNILAHGIGQVYALPIPLSYYLFSAAFAVASSFFLAAILIKPKSGLKTESYRRIVSLPKFLIPTLKVLGLIMLIFLIAVGIFGSQEPTKNILPTFFWVYFVVGMSVLSALIGNLWHVINPWQTISGYIGNLDQSNTKKSLPALAASILIMALLWLELVSGSSLTPQVLAMALAVYTLINIFAGEYFSNWYKETELFSALFSFIGRIAPFEIGDSNTSIGLKLPYASRFNAKASKSHLIIASIMLAGASFDSLKESVLWSRLTAFLGLEFPSMLLDTIALVLSPLPFLAAYLIIVWLIKKLSKSSDKTSTLALVFVWSLIPIAFGYFLAHNFSLIVVSLPKIVSLISDPFGYGWNILGASKLLSGGLVLGAKNVWFIEIFFVIAAHVAGVWVAHRIAADYFVDKTKIIKSQLPMMLLMILFTVVTLWLLSQPLVA